MGTLFATVYNRFLDKITDDMYLELTPEDTVRDLQNLLKNSIPGFEFPRKILDYTISMSQNDKRGFAVPSIEGTVSFDNSYFHSELSAEEVDILATLMLEGWLQRQITSIEVTRMKYGGTDFKMTSQANHLAKLLSLLKEVQRQSLHKQRLYKRRKTNADGSIASNWGVFGKNTVLGGKTEESSCPEFEEGSVVVYDGGVI